MRHEPNVDKSTDLNGSKFVLFVQMHAWRLHMDKVFLSRNKDGIQFQIQRPKLQVRDVFEKNVSGITR